MNPVDAYDAACSEERRAYREYLRCREARVAARAELLKIALGSKWEVSVNLNETVHGQAPVTEGGMK